MGAYQPSTMVDWLAGRELEIEPIWGEPLRRAHAAGVDTPQDVFLDFLANPERRLARRIATDLSESKGALASREEVFESEWRPRTPLAEVILTTFAE